MIVSLINQGNVKTTEAKAKAIRGLVDKLITRAKKGTVSSRRLIGSFLHSKRAVNKLVDEIAPTFKDRTSGFTRLVRLGNRRGDDAMMVSLEFISEEPAGIVRKKAARPTKKATAKSDLAKTESARPKQPKATAARQKQLKTTPKQAIRTRTTSPRTTHK